MVDYILQGFLALYAIIIVILFGYLTYITFWGEPEPDFRAACEDAGGNYEVIGSEYSPAVKVHVDIYGCVK